MATDASTSPLGHTPGPWVIARADSPLSALVSANDDEGDRNGGIYVAKAQGPDALANARLIAAAPELLEALSAIMPSPLCGESWNLPDDESVQIATSFGKIRAARAAIAKARGTTPAPEVSHVG